MPARSTDNRWDSKLARFVRGYGIDLLAERLGVTRDAIYKWIAGVVHMHPLLAQKIVVLARRRKTTISLDEIYQHFHEVRSGTSNSRTRRK